MQTKMEREESVRRLHLCIDAYQPTKSDIESLDQLQRELELKIQIKFARSNINENYVFPRRQFVTDEYGQKPQILDLHQQSLSSGVRPKIKLVKGRIDKRMKTEQANQNCQFFHIADHIQSISRKHIQSRDQESRVLNNIHNTMRLKTQSACQDKSERININKSKLSLLTRSYANLKSKLEHKETLVGQGESSKVQVLIASASKQLIPRLSNSFRCLPKKSVEKNRCVTIGSKIEFENKGNKQILNKQDCFCSEKTQKQFK